ncbi:MAG: hypothetical protein O7C68_05485, partial [Rickettsia endosymbiont of Ixodes ricinus]|nr:hypothetical protein [Rickettsia endosymbiont of Ixodes ricinus]
KTSQGVDCRCLPKTAWPPTFFVGILSSDSLLFLEVVKFLPGTSISFFSYPTTSYCQINS